MNRFRAASSSSAIPGAAATTNPAPPTGPIGAGNVTKLANQIMVACNIAAMGEALTLATRAGLDPECPLATAGMGRLCEPLERTLRSAPHHTAGVNGRSFGSERPNSNAS